MSTRLLSRVLEATGKLETNPESSVDEFGHLFIECAEQTLTDLVGARVREGLLDYLARHARLARGELLEHPRELSMLLERSLDRGGIEIEKCIMRNLYAVLEWEYKEPSNFNFVNQVEEARARWKTTSFTNTLSQSLQNS